MFVFLGSCTGILGFLPLALSLKASKKVTPKSNLGYGALLILGVFASLLILLIAVLLCYFFARDHLIAFVLAAAITLILFAIVYGFNSVIVRDKAAKERSSKNKKKNEGK